MARETWRFSGVRPSGPDRGAHAPRRVRGGVKGSPALLGAPKSLRPASRPDSAAPTLEPTTADRHAVQHRGSACPLRRGSRTLRISWPRRSAGRRCSRNRRTSGQVTRGGEPGNPPRLAVQADRPFGRLDSLTRERPTWITRGAFFTRWAKRSALASRLRSLRMMLARLIISLSLVVRGIPCYAHYYTPSV